MSHREDYLEGEDMPFGKGSGMFGEGGGPFDEDDEESLSKTDMKLASI